jgi:hypothetical protein
MSAKQLRIFPQSWSQEQMLGILLGLLLEVWDSPKRPQIEALLARMGVKHEVTDA